MKPDFIDGDNVLVKSFLFNLKVRDVVVFSSGSRNYLKRIVATNRKNYFLKGNCEHSSTYVVTKNQIKGKFLMKY